MTSSVTATFVFTDLVDSTATAARLGPVAAEELRQKHFRLLRGAVQASGGTEVKNLGDGLMVVYSSPSRALAGAVGMQQAIHHHNRSDGEPLGVRIGVSAGEAIEEDDDFFGDPVVEAARLCAAANGGQILAAEIVRSLVGRNATQTFVEVGPLALKGIPEPVDAVEVAWEPATVEGTVPLPGRLVGAASDALFGFFGRAAELAVLEGSVKEARSTRRCQVVFVAGEAGMGKTALVAQAARTAHSDGSIVLFGHSDEDVGIPYQPWIEVASTLVRDGDPHWFAGLRSAQRTALSRLVPEVGSDTDRVADPDTERLLLWEGTTEFLATASQRSPVLVVLDDLHWADTASLQLLRHVVASSTAMNLTVACTYRDTDLSRGDALTNLLADLHRQANVTRISLAGLEDVEIIELLAAAAGHDLDDSGVGLAHALRRETDGNPFFTGEVIRHLGETGGIVLGDVLTGRLLLAGHANDAETKNDETLEFGTRASVPDALATFGGYLYAIRQHQGRLDEIAEFFIDAARDNPSIAALRSAVIYLLCQLGRIDEARERLAAEAANGFDFPYNVSWLAAMANLLDAAATVQDRAAARALVERVAPFASQVIAVGASLVQGAIARPLARAATVLGDYDQAEAWFATAHDLHTRLQAPYWTAMGKLDHADLCLARNSDGDVDRAHKLGTNAAAAAAEYGCAGLGKRADALLASI